MDSFIYVENSAIKNIANNDSEEFFPSGGFAMVGLSEYDLNSEGTGGKFLLMILNSIDTIFIYTGTPGAFLVSWSESTKVYISGSDISGMDYYL